MLADQLISSYPDVTYLHLRFEKKTARAKGGLRESRRNFPVVSREKTKGKNWPTRMKALACYLFCMTIISFAIALPINKTIVNLIHSIVPDIVRTSNQDLLRLYETSQDVEVRPGLFEGDIAVTSEYFDYWRVGLRWDVFPDKLWENRTVPYVISALYDTADYVKIYKAITYINYMTCIKFVPWDGKAKDFLLIWPIMYPKGCWSFVGKFGGAQILSLEPPDEKGPNCLENEGRAIHELMHALGIFHEHSRADRDTYIDIHYENIIPGFRSNFNKQSPENATYSYEYGYDSIMHYGSHFFSVDPTKPTLTPKIPGVVIGQRKAMSKIDCLKLNDLYGCLDKKPEEARIYYNICKTLGL